MPQQPVYLDENGNPIEPVYLDENGNPISKGPEGSAVSRLASDAAKSIGEIIQGIGEMMMAPGNISGLTSKIAEPFVFGPELSGADKAKLAIGLATGFDIPRMEQRWEEGDIAGMIGTGLPAAAMLAIPFLRGTPKPRPTASPKIVADLIRSQKFLEIPKPGVRALLSEATETRLPSQSNLKDIVIPTEGIIPEPVTQPWIGGPSGGEGMVIPPTIEATPRLQARVGGKLFPQDAGPAGSVADLDHLREQARLRNIYYGEGEQLGLGSLQIPDKPNINIPPVAGDTSLGFNPRTQAELPYPLNVVPERLHPRATQTEIAKATPEAIREPAQPPFISQEVFLDASLPDEPKPVSRGFPVKEDYVGTLADEKGKPSTWSGTALPGRSQLPSAPPKPKRITPKVEAEQVVSEIRKSPEPTVRKLAYQEPVKEAFIKRMTSKTLDIGKKVGRGYNKSKWTWEAGEKTLDKLGPAGKIIRRKLAEWSRDEHQLATRWESRAAQTISKLSKEEYKEFMFLADSGNYKSVNPKIQRVLDAIKQNEAEIFAFVNQLGIRIPGTSRVVKPMEGYTPRIYPEGFWQDATMLSKALKEKFPGMSEDTITKIVKRRTAGLVDQLMTELGVSRDVAETIIHLGKLKSEKKISPQYIRRLDLPGYRTDPLIWSEHYADWAKKVARTHHFGPKDIGDPFSTISMLIEQTRNPDLAKRIMNVIMGRRNYSPNAAFYQKVNRMANGFAARAYLSMFYISNVANNITIPLRMNLRALTHGVKEAILHPKAAREFASDSGALYGVTRTLIEESYKRRSTADPLRYYGMTASENMNRIISAGAGKYYAQQLFGKLKKGKLNSYEMEQLYDLTLTDPNILATQSQLTSKQLHSAGFMGAELTQGLGEARKVPPAWNNPNPVVQLPLIFKRYAFQQTKIIKDALFGPGVPMKTRARNLAYLVAISQPLGYALGEVKGAIRGTVRGLAEGDIGGGIEHELEHRSDPTRRLVSTFLGKEFAEDDEIANIGGISITATDIIDNMVNAWALGMVADLMYMASGDARSFFFDVAGPAAGPPMEVGFNVLKGLLPGGNMIPAYRTATKMIPFVGPGLQRAFFPTKFQEE